MINPSIFKAYDVRAVYTTQIDAEGWCQVIRGTYTYLTRKLNKDLLTVNLSRDMRVESESCYNNTKEELVALGARINDIGLASTAHSYFALLHLQADAAIQITASHNPSGYTGMKCTVRDGNRVVKISGTDIKTAVLEIPHVGNRAGGIIIPHSETLPDEIVTTAKDFPAITRRFKVVVDTANGMGVTYLKELQKHIPLDIIFINEKLDGTFPSHLSDTCQHSLWHELCDRVVKEKADFGIATDGDADRIAFVDEQGRFVPSTLITCLIIDKVNKTQPNGLYLVDVRSLFNVSNFAKKIGAHMQVTKVGHAHITHDMHVTYSPFGGESSGHYYFKQSGGAENIARVILSVITRLQDTSESFSRVLAHYETAYEAVEINFVLPDTLEKQQVFDRIVQEHPKAEIDLLDGISVNYPEWRANVRGSNTEPLLRLNVEALTPELLDKQVSMLQSFLESLGAQLKKGH